MPMFLAAIRLFSFCLAVVATVGPLCAAAPDGDMIELTLRGRKLLGVPLAWDAEAVHLLGRDGRLWEFAPGEASDFRKTSSRFRPYSPSEFRAELLRDFGDGYEVGGTGHYMVALPKGQRDKWAERFEELYRSFVHFFTVRGMQISQPPFLLAGVVCRSQNEFMRRMANEGLPASSAILGYYDLETNRIHLYDMSGGGRNGDWRENAAVLIHEATHQTAFNTGVHSRYYQNPTWLVEGLAMLFEAPGVYDSYHYTQPADRVNRGRLSDFRQIVPHHRPELLTAMVANDKFFRLDPAAAYAEAWAFTFFLIETEPSKYVAYLKRTAGKTPFQEYTAAERIADFTAVFGSDWRMLEAKFLRFMSAVE